MCYREEAINLFDECPPRKKVKEHEWQKEPDRKMYVRHFVVEKSYSYLENEVRCTLYTRKYPAYWNSEVRQQASFLSIPAGANSLLTLFVV